MITPWILANRTLYITTYSKHGNLDDVENGEYTLFRSSQGNDAISNEHAERTGADVEADMILFWVKVTPVSANRSRMQFVIKLNLGGSIPNKLR